ncbi:MAG: DNA polymerase III subunit chi [Pseudomonadota bacterium]
MTTIQFYHLTITPLERALPKLLERALAGGYKVCLVAESDERVEQLNQLLWTYDPASFLAHGSDKDEQPENQQILLSTGTEPLNSANLLVVTDGRSVKQEEFERILDVFDGNDAKATVAARARWTEYKNSGHEITYFSQNEQGGWQKG